MTTTAASPATVTAPPAPRRRRRRGTPWSAVALYGALGVFALLYLFPFLIQLGTSFKTDADATNQPLNPVPSTWSLDAFRQLADSDYGLWFLNTALVAVVVTTGRLFLDSLAGYALARLRFPGRRALSAGLIALIAVPPVVLLVPKFLIINQFGMYDAYTGMIIPLIADATGIYIMKQFFETVPREVEEAAVVDGAGPFRTFWSVVLPMATPALITLSILAFQSSWNELAHMLVSRDSPQLATLTVGVAQLVSGELGAGNRFPLKLAAALIMTIPVAVVFFVFQRRFVRGANEGSVKG